MNLKSPPIPSLAATRCYFEKLGILTQDIGYRSRRMCDEAQCDLYDL